jgi:tetratricopeptide (TPR) repeat protein
MTRPAPFSRQVGDRHGEDLERGLGRHEQARSAYDEARTLFKQEGHRFGEAHVLRGLGDLERGLGRHEQARSAYDDAAQLFGSLGMMTYRGEVLRAAADLASS